jgi:hypothetical protein
LYSLAGVLVAALIFEGRLPLSGAGHKVVQAGLVLAGYGVIWLWLNANRMAMLSQPRARSLRDAPRPATRSEEDVPAQDPYTDLAEKDNPMARAGAVPTYAVARRTNNGHVPAGADLALRQWSSQE